MYNSFTGSEYFTVLNGALVANNTLDHENNRPGPEITVKLECEVRHHKNAIPRIHYHSFTVDIQDINDNGPRIQNIDEVYEIRIDHLHFRKVSRQVKVALIKYYKNLKEHETICMKM